MRTLFFGFVSMMVVVALSLEGSIGMYAQKHAMFIVLGGTFSVLFFSNPTSVLHEVKRALAELVKNEPLLEVALQQCLELSKRRTISGKAAHPLIAYAIDLWDQGIDPNLFVVLLSQKKQQLESEGNDAVQAVKNLAKYPPALGMLGTVMGMISMFSALDSNKDGIGQSIAMAMTATFFGLFLANGFLSPLADRLHIRHIAKRRGYSDLYKILLLINQNEPSALISEEIGGSTMQRPQMVS